MGGTFFNNEGTTGSVGDVSGSIAKRLNKSFRGYSKKSVETLLEETCRSAEDMKNNLEKQIRDLFNEKSTLSQECSLLRGQLAEIEGKHEKKVEKLQALLETEKDNGDSLKDELAQLNKENKNLSDKLAGQKKEQEDIRQLNKDLAASRNEFEGMIGEFRVAEGALKKTREKLEEKNQQLAELNNELAEKDDQLNMLKNEVEDLIQKSSDKNVQQYETENMELSKEIERLKKVESELDGLRSELKEKDEASQNNIKAHRELRSKYNVLDANYNSLIQKHDELTAENGSLIEKQDELTAQNSSLIQKQDELAAEKEGLLHLVNMYQKKEQEYALTYKENEEYLKTIHDLENAIEVILSEMEEQKGIFNDMVSQYDSGKSEVRKLVQENIQVQMKNIELLDQVNVLTSRLTRLEEENYQASKRMDRLDLNAEESQRNNKDRFPNFESDSAGEYDNKIAFDAIRRAKKANSDYASNVRIMNS